MATGSITSLGIGSGLDLQNILDQLKAADSQVIDAKKTKKTEYQTEIDAYNALNAKLFAMKSDALNLSLQSNFMKNGSALTDENILDAVVADGLAESSYTIDVTRKASRNSWEAAGVSSATDIMFAEPDTDIAAPEDAAVTANDTMSIYYGEAGSEQQIDITVTAGMTLNEVIEAVNTSTNNQDGDGNQLVNASLATNEDDEYFIRLSAVSGGNTADSEITLAGFDYVAADTTVGITQGSSTMYLSVAAGTTYQQFTDLVNNADNNPGVTAAMIDNGNAADPYQFTLTADNTGEDARITLSNLTMTEVTGAGADSLDAMFTVNGIAYKRQSNSGISDVISGVTLTLNNTGETTLDITRETESVKEDILALVDGFNDLIAYINGTSEEETTTGDETEDDEDNPLANSSDVNRLVSSLTAMFTTIVDVDSAYTSLADLGMEINQDGTITLDEDVLDQAMAADPDAVRQMFIGDEENEITGMGDLLNDGILDMVSDQGIVATRLDALETYMDRLDEDIEEATERLDKRYETMQAEFARLDSYIRELNSEAQYMQSMFDSLNQTEND